MALSGVFRHPFPLSPVPLPGYYDVDSPGALTPRLLPSIILCLSSYADPCLPVSLMTRDGVIFVFLFGDFRPTREFFNYMQTSPLPVEDCIIKHKLGNCVSLSNEGPYTRETRHLPSLHMVISVTPPLFAECLSYQSAIPF